MRREEWSGGLTPAPDSDIPTVELSNYLVVSRDAFCRRESALADSRCDDDSQEKRSDTDGRPQK